VLELPEVKEPPTGRVGAYLNQDRQTEKKKNCVFEGGQGHANLFTQTITQNWPAPQPCWANMAATKTTEVMYGDSASTLVKISKYERKTKALKPLPAYD